MKVPQINWQKTGIDTHDAKKHGGKTFCPQCHNKRKNKRDRSLSVDLERGIWNCHNCQWKGTAVEWERTEERKIYRKPTPKSKAPETKAVEWFKARGISKATLDRMKVAESVEWMPQPAAERNCICFQYFRDGELVNIKYRDGQKNFKMEKDAELIFYNLDSLKTYPDRCIIVEGEIDALSLVECNMPLAVLSVPNGASKGSQRLEYLDNCWQHLSECKEIIIATDGDEPGRALGEELARRLGKERCFSVKYPEGCKDANEVLLKHGRVGIGDLIKNAEGYPLEGIQTANDLYDDCLDLFQNGYPPGMKTGYEDFDKLLSVASNDFTIITGTPGSGKSTFLNNLLVRYANRYGWRIAMFTPEKQPVKFLIVELVAIFVGKGLRDNMTIDEFNAGMKWVNDHFFIMKIDEMDVTMDGILSLAVVLVMYYGINALVIDPWNYVEHKRDRGQSETDYISEQLTKIKRFKDRYNCATFLIAHPVKIEKDKDTKLYVVPDLYKISGSANFYNKTDNGLVVYRNYQTLTTDIYVQKIRNDWSGSEGMCSFTYEKSTRRFYPADTGITNTIPVTMPQQFNGYQPEEE